MSSLGLHAPSGVPSLLLPRPLATGNCETLPSGALWSRGSTSRLTRLLQSSNLRRARSFEDSANRPLIPDDEEVKDVGVQMALSMLRFYKREISPLLLSSCRYVPTCSEYSMQAYKKYGVAKGTVLTAWRLCRCNPLGGSGFDPPRWFDEDKPNEDL